MQTTPDVRLAACSADPAATYHAASGAAGGLRVVGAEADVDEVLGSDAWLVVPPSAPDPRAQALLAKTARFSEGREHLERRAAMESPMSGVQPLEPGDPAQVGAYRLLGRLGAGGMGQVFLGVSRGGRKVAVKVLRADLVTDAEFRARFAREVAVARTVNGFYTAPVVDADPDATPPWMVTAYVQGPSLAAAVAERGPLSELKVRNLAAALAEGLASIHAGGLNRPRSFRSGVLACHHAPDSLPATGPHGPARGAARPGYAVPNQGPGEAVVA